MNIFEFETEIISTETFTDQLSQFIRKGDTVYVEIDVMKFGKLCNPLMQKNELLHQIFLIFYNLIGESGNLIIPSFSYSWGYTSNKKIFDVRNTKGQVGIFPEYFRTMEGVLRTPDPMFSLLVYGKDKKYFTDIGNDSFGKRSSFNKMHEANAKLVMFGLKSYGPMFVHYTEQYYDEHIGKIDYRFLKKFEGDLIDYEGKCSSTPHYAFVRPPDTKLCFGDQKIVNGLKKKGRFGSVKIGNGNVSVSDCQSVFDTGIEGLKKDKHFFVEELVNDLT